MYPTLNPIKEATFMSPVDQVMKRRYDMPYPEEQSLEKKRRLHRLFDPCNVVEQSSESPLFHDHVYHVEKDAHKDKTDTGMYRCLTCQREPCSIKTESYALPLTFKDDYLHAVSDNKRCHRKKKSQTGVF